MTQTTQQIASRDMLLFYPGQTLGSQFYFHQVVDDSVLDEQIELRTGTIVQFQGSGPDTKLARFLEGRTARWDGYNFEILSGSTFRFSWLWLECGTRLIVLS